MPPAPEPSRCVRPLPPPCRIPECHKAVHEFLDRHGLKHKITQVDAYGAWLRKDAAVPPIDQSWYLTFNASRSTDDAPSATPV